MNEDIIKSLKDILDEINETPKDSFVDITYIKETLEDILKMSEVGKLRLIKSGNTVWSIKNQANIILSKDTIVEIKHTGHGNDYIFVKPMQLLFAHSIPGCGLLPCICGLGTDEWLLDYKNTEDYEIPSPSHPTIKAPLNN